MKEISVTIQTMIEPSNKEILELLKDKRTKCIVYTRVMGYHRPVEGFNLGKKGEHKERVKFVERDIKCC